MCVCVTVLSLNTANVTPVYVKHFCTSTSSKSCFHRSYIQLSCHSSQLQVPVTCCVGQQLCAVFEVLGLKIDGTWRIQLNVDVSNLNRTGEFFDFVDNFI